MNRSFASSIKLVILLGTLSLVLLGCAHTICFKMVDANTKEPLSGVSVQWLQARHQMLLRIKHEGPTNLPPSGRGGVIKIEGLHRNWVSEFIFSCPGYSNVYGFYSAGSLGLAERISYFPPGLFQDEFMLEGKLTGGSLTNGYFLIPMQK